MIGRIRGVLEEKAPPEILVDVNGVGYELHIPMSTLFSLPGTGSSVTLWTHLSVSENAQTLYGFYTQKERSLFRILIKISGVGPKMALGILSGMNADQLVSCVMQDNLSALTKLPGVGNKTAQRLLVELKDKLKTWASDSAPLADMEAASVASPRAIDDKDIIAEAESALVSLGYKPTEASKVVAGVLKNHTATRSEELIRLALRSLVPA